MTPLHSVSPTDVCDYIDPRHPVLAVTAAVDRPHHIHTHAHPRGQLIYASTGKLQVKATGPVIMVPAQFALWIPPGTTHAVSASTAIDYCSLFVDPSASHVLPARAQLLHLTTLFKSLTTTAAGVDMTRIAGAEQRLNAVIYDQLQMLRPARLALPLPSLPQLHTLVSHYLTQPADPLDLPYWSEQLSMSVRTLSRHFYAETGMSVGQWLQHLRVLNAIERLEQGETVKNVAYELGYQQPSAFIVMFKRITGQTPREYLAEQQMFALH